MTTEETMVEEETTFVKIASDEENSDVRGGESNQSVDAEQLTHVSHEESSRFVIKSVIDPRTDEEISMDQVSARPLHSCLQRLAEMEPGLRVPGQRVTGSAIWVRFGSGHGSKPYPPTGLY